MENGLDQITCWTSKKECSKQNLPKELQLIKKFASWNGYPKNIASAIIKRVLSKETSTNDVTSNEEKDKILTVFINIDYPGEKGEHLLKKCFKKLGCSINQKVHLVCRYSVMKISFFTNMKDKLNKISKSNVAYQFSCPGCESSYTGKTERTLFERTKEQVTRVESEIKGRLDNCLNVEHLVFISNLILNVINKHNFRLNLVRQNTRIIDESNNWNVLLFTEAYHINEKCPILNNGVKASREMQLFWMQFSHNVYTNHVLIVSFHSNMFLDYILLFMKLV